MANKDTQWKPGQSGNPNGRPPKGYSITEWFQKMLEKNPKTKDAIGKAILTAALKGDVAAQRLVWQYMDGMPQQDITSKGEKVDSLNGLLSFIKSGGVAEAPESD